MAKRLTEMLMYDRNNIAFFQGICEKVVDNDYVLEFFKVYAFEECL